MITQPKKEPLKYSASQKILENRPQSSKFSFTKFSIDLFERINIESIFLWRFQNKDRHASDEEPWLKKNLEQREALK